MRWVGPLALLVASFVSILVAEGILRLIEGQPIDQLHLRTPVFAPKPLPSTLAPLAQKFTWDEAVDPTWIDALPPANKTPAPSEQRLIDLDESKRRDALPSYLRDRQWNSNWVRFWGCREGAEFRNITSPVYIFPAPQNHALPQFRFPLKQTTALGLVTNQYGWRGPDIALNKQPNFIRLAFVGASTTVGNHGYRFSYPEYVVHWMNLWARENGHKVRFDGINAGREGIGSQSIKAIVETEVLPMEPDLVLYYEGSNQFNMTPLINRDVEQRSVFDQLETPWWRQRLLPLENRSILVRKLREFGDRIRLNGGREPDKPDYTLTWPEDVDEFSPDIEAPNLPVQLSQIFSDLTTIKNDVEVAGAELALASFVWLVYDGLQLDPVRQAWFLHFFRTRYWPFRYSDIRRLADFQNRALKTFAEQNDLLFVELAEKYPMDTSLFVDGIHFSEDGIRLQAWIVFQSLLPRIRERIATGAWPRPDEHFLLVHPGISKPRRVESPCENLDAF